MTKQSETTAELISCPKAKILTTQEMIEWLRGQDASATKLCEDMRVPLGKPTWGTQTADRLAAQEAEIVRLRDTLKVCQRSLKSSFITIHGKDIWINSRVKGAAQWSCKDAEPAWIKSFTAMQRLQDNALEACEKALQPTEAK